MEDDDEIAKPIVPPEEKAAMAIQRVYRGFVSRRDWNSSGSREVQRSALSRRKLARQKLMNDINDVNAQVSRLLEQQTVLLEAHEVCSPPPFLHLVPVLEVGIAV